MIPKTFAILTTLLASVFLHPVEALESEDFRIKGPDTLWENDRTFFEVESDAPLGVDTLLTVQVIIMTDTGLKVIHQEEIKRTSQKFSFSITLKALGMGLSYTREQIKLGPDRFKVFRGNLLLFSPSGKGGRKKSTVLEASEVLPGCCVTSLLQLRTPTLSGRNDFPLVTSADSSLFAKFTYLVSPNPPQYWRWFLYGFAPGGIRLLDSALIVKDPDSKETDYDSVYGCRWKSAWIPGNSDSSLFRDADGSFVVGVVFQAYEKGLDHTYRASAMLTIPMPPVSPLSLTPNPRTRNPSFKPSSVLRGKGEVDVLGRQKRFLHPTSSSKEP